MLLKAERLAGVHPDLIRVMETTARLCPFDIVVLEGVRSKERQQKLLAQGATKTLNSRHLTGHAVDIAPHLDTDNDGDEEVSWHWPHYGRLAPHVRRAAEQEGVEVEWGGDWATFPDGPHWQLPWGTYP